jgi:2'-5' RNA ligase
MLIRFVAAVRTENPSFEYATSIRWILTRSPAMPRLFTALDLPDDVLTTLRAFQDDQALPGRARWTPMNNHHITLRFIGDVDKDTSDAIEAALSAVRAEPFPIEPLGLGVLPSRRKPRVLTVRVDASERLRNLYRSVQDALAAVDIQREERRYRPHITLARLKEVTPERLYATLREMDGPQLDAFPVDRFYLYESTLTPDGAVHTVRAAYPLDA